MKALLENLKRHGVTLAANDSGGLLVESIHPLTAKQWELIAANKPALLAALAEYVLHEHAEHGNMALPAPRGVHLPNDVDFSALPLPTLEDEQQPLAIAIPATRDPNPQPDKYQLALEALAACGWTGVSAVNVARAIADGETDPHLLESLLASAVTHPFHS